MRGYVYILKDKDWKYYIGSTSDISRRLKEHKYGTTYTTKRMNDFKVVLIQQYKTLAEARKTELRLKKFKRRDFIDKMINDGFIKIKAD